ncbi:MAG: LEPR-XLL domain-containing protein, partial [Anaerolineae bacterium]
MTRLFGNIRYAGRRSKSVLRYRRCHFEQMEARMLLSASP